MRDQGEGPEKHRRDAVRRWSMTAAVITVVVALGAAGHWILTHGDQRTIEPIASDVPALAEPKACSEATVGDNVVAFVNEFMRRRTSGAGAEACLSDRAVDQYGAKHADRLDAKSETDELCLYTCGRFRVVGFAYDSAPHDSAEAVESGAYGTYESVVTVTLSDGTQTLRRSEALEIGPGVASPSDEPQALLIRDVRTTS